MIIHGNLGRTKYELDTGGGTLSTASITRENGDGKTKVFFPREMLVEYANAVIKDRVRAVLEELLK